MTGKFATSHTRRMRAVALGLSFFLSVWYLSLPTLAGRGTFASLNENTTNRPELVLQTGHSKGVNCSAFGPDGSWLASGGSDNAIKIWQVASGRELRALTGHTNYVKSLAASRNGRWLASGSSDRTVKVWEVATGHELYSLPGHTSSIEALAFSPDNRWLASGSSDGTVCLWPTESDRERCNLKHNMSSVIALAFDSSGVLISAHQDGGIEFWNTNTAKEGRAIPGDANAEQLVFAAFSPGADTLAFGAGDRVVNLRKLTGGEETRTLESHSTAFNAVDFSRDGRWFASAANDSSIRLWQVATGRELPRLSGHMGFVNTVTFSPNGHLLASGSASGEVKVWDMSTGRLAFSLPTSPKGINIVA